MTSEPLSPSEKLIFIVAILCGLFVHFYDLGLLSAWTDELASIFYTDHLSVVYGDETHPPLFYLYMKPFQWMLGKNLAGLRAVVSATSLGLIVWACFLCKKLYGLRGALLLGILLCFSPYEIAHSRMIRQYSIFFELTVILLLYAQIPDSRLIIKTILAFILCGIHPIGFFPVVSMGLYLIWTNKKLTRESLIYFMMTGLVFLYYVSKMFFLGSKKYLTNYQPHREFNFYMDILKTISGEHFPKTNYFPVPLWFTMMTGIMIAAIIGFAIRKKLKNPLLIFLFVAGFSLLSTEIITLVMVNIKLGRYYGFLVAPVLLLAVAAFHQNKYAAAVAFSIGLVSVTAINPFNFFPGERETLGKDFDLEKSVLCANKYQYYYYFDRETVNCLDRFKYFLENKKDFVYVDLNGYGRNALIYYSRFFEISDFQYHGVTFRAKATYLLHPVATP